MKTSEVKPKRGKRRRGDVCHEPSKELLANLPAKVDLRRDVPARLWPVWDQGATVSCTAHAAAGILLYARIRAGHRPYFQPSRRFLYHCEQVAQKRDHVQGCGTVRFAIDMPNMYGACADAPARSVPKGAVWLFDGDYRIRPPESCFAFARKHREPIPVCYLQFDVDHLRGRLAEGHPFTILIKRFASFNRPTVRASGRIPTPSGAGPPVDFHAMVVVGYDHAKRRFLVRNSAGPSWGDGGYGTIAYDYVLDQNLSDPNSIYTLRLE